MYCCMKDSKKFVFFIEITYTLILRKILCAFQEQQNQNCDEFTSECGFCCYD